MIFVRMRILMILIFVSLSRVDEMNSKLVTNGIWAMNVIAEVGLSWFGTATKYIYTNITNNAIYAFEKIIANKSIYEKKEIFDKRIQTGTFSLSDYCYYGKDTELQIFLGCYDLNIENKTSNNKVNEHDPDNPPYDIFTTQEQRERLNKGKKIGRIQRVYKVYTNDILC